MISIFEGILDLLEETPCRMTMPKFSFVPQSETMGTFVLLLHNSEMATPHSHVVLRQ